MLSLVEVQDINAEDLKKEILKIFYNNFAIAKIYQEKKDLQKQFLNEHLDFISQGLSKI
jgi:hypothetical protein